MLSDTDIRQELTRRQSNSDEGIAIEPFEEKCLTPVGYDLRVGKKGFSWKSKREIDIERDGPIQIDPYDTLIVETLESISLPREFSGTVHSMVSKVIPRGLSHISTTIDPGWTGKLLISVHNFYDIPTELRFGEKLCTACFYGVNSRATKGVGTQPDREDIWDQLIAKSGEKRREDAKRRSEKTVRNLILISIAVVILVVGIQVSFRDPSLGAAIAAFLAIVVPVLLDLLRSK